MFIDCLTEGGSCTFTLERVEEHEDGNIVVLRRETKEGVPEIQRYTNVGSVEYKGENYVLLLPQDKLVLARLTLMGYPEGGSFVFRVRYAGAFYYDLVYDDKELLAAIWDKYVSETDFGDEEQLGVLESEAKFKVHQSGKDFVELENAQGKFLFKIEQTIYQLDKTYSLLTLVSWKTVFPLDGVTFLFEDSRDEEGNPECRLITDRSLSERILHRAGLSLI